MIGFVSLDKFLIGLKNFIHIALGKIPNGFIFMGKEGFCPYLFIIISFKGGTIREGHKIIEELIKFRTPN